jgi:hypothetical protein
MPGQSTKEFLCRLCAQGAGSGRSEHAIEEEFLPNFQLLALKQLAILFWSMAALHGAVAQVTPVRAASPPAALTH